MMDEKEWLEEMSRKLKALGASDAVVKMARHYAAPGSAPMDREAYRGRYELASELLGEHANKMTDPLYRHIEREKEKAYSRFAS